MQKSLKILSYFIVGGIFLTPFLVLVVPGSLFFPFITGKNFSFRILTEIIFGLWLILVIFDKNYLPSRPKKNLILMALVVFTFILILSTIFSVNPYRSFWSNYERMEGLVTFLHLLAFFLVMVSVLKREKLWKWFFHLSIGISIIVAIYGMLQLAGKLQIHQSDVRLDATLGNASYLAIYMVFHIFLCLFYFLREKNWYRWFYIPAGVLQTIILYHTATRGAILGLISGLFLTLILIALFSASKRVKMISLSFLGLIVVLVGLFFVFKSSAFIQQSPVLSRFSSISWSETTTQSRLVIWRMSWQGFNERPILGWGLDNYNLIFNKYYQPILWRQEAWFDRAHNVFLDRLTTNGILGLASYLSLFLGALYCLWIKRKHIGFSVEDSAIFTSMFAAYFFHNLFVFDNLITLLLFFSVLAYISSRSQPIEKIHPSSVSEKNIGAKTALTMVIGIAFIFIIYFINIPPLLACHDILSAFQSAGTGNFQEAFQKFQQSIAYNTFGRFEAREQVMSFATQILNQSQIDQNLKQKVYDYAVAEMKKQNEEVPNDIRYLLFLGSLYNKGGQYDKAIEVLNKAVALSPKKQQLYFELGDSYLNEKNYPKALEILKTSFALDPNFLEARKIYALAEIFNGDYDLADNLMKDYGGLIIPDERFINAFAAIGRLDKVAAIWEKMIAANPSNAQYRVSLGASYFQMGEREKAIEQLQKAIELEPRFKQQGEYYINQIRSGKNP